MGPEGGNRLRWKLFQQSIVRDLNEVEPISNQSVKSLDCGNESIERGPLARTFRRPKKSPLLGSLLFKFKKVSMRSQNPLREFCLTACWKAFLSCSWLPSTWPFLLLYLGYLQPGDESSSTLKPLRSCRAMSLLAVARPSIEATSADCDCTWCWIKALSRSRRRCATGLRQGWTQTMKKRRFPIPFQGPSDSQRFGSSDTQISN